MNPYEQEALDKDPFRVMDDEIEARVSNVYYESTDYNHATRCTLTFDNGFRVCGVADRAPDEIAETLSYQRALSKARPAFEFMKAERLHWINEQAREAGVLAAMGTHGGD